MGRAAAHREAWVRALGLSPGAIRTWLLWNDSDLWQDMVGTREVSLLPLVAGLPGESSGC